MSIFLTEITIRNFRGIEHANFKLSRVNFFVSENGTGKTSCLAAIARLFPLLRGEERVFLDADFRVTVDSSAPPILIQYRFKFSAPDAEEEELSLMVEATRSNTGASKSHLNSQELSTLDLQRAGPETTWVSINGPVVGKGKQRVIRNGWAGNRICPIDLNRSSSDQHAATSIGEESGASDGFRARMVALMQDAPQKSAVEKSFPNLENNVASFFNSSVSSDPIDGFRVEEGSSQTVILRDSGVTTAFECLSGGEMASINLAMSQEFILNAAECDFVFWEEPEACFHPATQTQLLTNFLDSFAQQQIFISTHSPFVLGNFPPDCSIIIAKKDNGASSWTNLDRSAFLFGQASVSELSFLAYDHPTFDYLNQLYGFLQAREGQSTINGMDQYLSSAGLAQSRTWIRSNGNLQAVTLATFIRNSGHHPENRLNAAFTRLELAQAINDLRTLL